MTVEELAELMADPEAWADLQEVVARFILTTHRWASAHPSAASASIKSSSGTDLVAISCPWWRWRRRGWLPSTLLAAAGGGTRFHMAIRSFMLRKRLAAP